MFRVELSESFQELKRGETLSEQDHQDSTRETEQLAALADLSDWEFDRLLFDEKIRSLSEVHWTPIKVARRAAELLSSRGNCRILDVGSGAGKFCFLGALSTQCVFVGIERRKPLVDCSQSLVKRWGLPRTSFVHGDAADLNWRDFDGIYLYNPFFENVVDTIRLEPLFKLSQETFQSYIRMTQDKLHDMRPGTRVATFFGFGGKLPSSYRLEREERFRGGPLQLWVKQAIPTSVQLPLNFRSEPRI